MGNAVLSKKDERYRDFALHGSMWLVVLQVGIPLALYQSLNQFFKLLDSMMASHISATSVSAVAYLTQISAVLGAIGSGFAIGGSLEISKAYGAGDYDMVKKRVNSLLAMCALLGLIVLAMVPFVPQLLKLANMPEELISVSSKYFAVELITLVITYLNNVYIAVERARGKSKRILILNLCVILTKLLLTALFVYVLNKGIMMIAVATLISQSIIFVAGVINLNKREDAFGFSLKSISIQRKVISPMVKLSVPVVIEKMAFSLGKVIVNSMSGRYGGLAVGALGISNSIGGITTGPQGGFQEGGASIISQNLGAGNTKRAFEAFRKILIINIIIGVIGLVMTLVFVRELSSIFASSQDGFNDEFQTMIINMYRYECFGGCIPLAVNASVVALLLGFGYTKLTLVINFCRLFVFRIPVLYAIQKFTNLGAESCGITMLISNLSVSIMSMVVVIIVIKKICREQKITFFDHKSSGPLN